ncbi:hypothetical protein LINPERHAP1_LOCUS7605 [Linum perenne]
MRGEFITLCRLINCDWEVSFSHTYRGGNQAVDYLASIEHTLPIILHVVATSNCNLIYFLRHDCMGITEPKIISSN